MTPAAEAGWPFGVTTVQRLAKQIDRLQRHVDEYGTVVAKSPDVTGESRLLRHRIQFEKQMAAELEGFEFRLNAAQSSRDSSFLASALALNASMNGNFAPGATEGAPPTPIDVEVDTTMVGVTSTLLPTQAQLQTSTSNLVPRSGFSGPTFSSNFKGSTKGADGNVALSLGIEPTIYLDQKKRYLDHLNAIRRGNEGDDIADSPGYSLNLVRIPVSILPGQKTREGFGAEIHCTIQPHLSEELLPTSFRDLVINDIVQRIGLPVLNIADNLDMKVLSDSLEAFYASKTSSKEPTNSNTPEMQAPAVSIPSDTNEAPRTRSKENSIESLSDFYIRARKSKENATYGQASGGRSGKTVDGMGTAEGENSEEKLEGQSKLFLRLAYAPLNYSTGLNQRKAHVAIPATHQPSVNGVTLMRVSVDTFKALSSYEQCGDKKPGQRGLDLPSVESHLKRELEAAYHFLSSPNAMILWSHCNQELALAIQEHRGYLSGAQYDYAKSTPQGEFTLKDQQRLRLHRARGNFFRDLRENFPEMIDSTTGSLAWQIIVQSAVLNEQLVQDMKELSASKNCHCMPIGWQAFYGPNPPMEARMAFNEYVRCRWPIHVFAIDPITQDQNIGSSFSERREMQMVLALAASQRRISLQSLTQFMRRMEYDLETIELNRTAVGFSHGDDSFGWRFYPRVQTPPIPSNLTAAVRDNLIGGRSKDRDLIKRRLEPGVRECTAIVVMPSFVPYVTVDTRSNWFRLGDKHSKLLPIHRAQTRELDLRDAMKLSEEITSLRQLTQACVEDAHLYRNGDVQRLLRAVDQLDSQLPLQTAYVQVPYENTLGGTEMFSSGATDLAPELRGWYGAPGIRAGLLTSGAQQAYSALRASAARLAVKYEELAQLKAAKKPTTTQEAAIKLMEADHAKVHSAAITASATPVDSTTVFLVGKNLSVLDNEVIAGGEKISQANIRLISRELIQVTIPSTVSTVCSKQFEGQECRDYVSVHLATPYGPTRPLLIPVDTGGCKKTTTTPSPSEEITALKKELTKKIEENRPKFSWDPTTKPALQMIHHSHAAIRSMIIPTLLNTSDYPEIRPVDGEVAFFASFVTKGAKKPTELKHIGRTGKSEKIPYAHGPYLLRPVGMNQYSINNSDKVLSAVMQDVLTQAGSLKDVEKVILHGYLRTEDQGGNPHTDRYPVIRLPDLTYAVDVPKPVTTTPAAAPAPATPGTPATPALKAPMKTSQEEQDVFNLFSSAEKEPPRILKVGASQALHPKPRRIVR